MSDRCGGHWHDYPNCDACPSLGDDCDGSEEYWDTQKEVSQAEDKRDADIELYMEDTNEKA